jgi:hypothetical protein
MMRMMLKRLELLKELLPRLARVAVLWNAANPYPARPRQSTEDGVGGIMHDVAKNGQSQGASTWRQI